MYFIFVYKSLYIYEVIFEIYLVNEISKPNIFLWQTFYLKKFNKLEAEPSQEELAELKRQKKLANKVSDYFFFWTMHEFRIWRGQKDLWDGNLLKKTRKLKRKKTRFRPGKWDSRKNDNDQEKKEGNVKHKFN